MAFRCSALMTISDADRSIESLVESVRSERDQTIALEDVSSEGELMCRVLSGRPHEIKNINPWRELNDDHSSLSPAVTIIEQIANNHYSESGCGYYPDARVPTIVLDAVYKLVCNHQKLVWIYFSETSGGSLECEYSWMISSDVLMLSVWDEEEDKCRVFTDAGAKLCDKSSFLIGQEFLSITRPELLKSKLFDVSN